MRRLFVIIIGILFVLGCANKSQCYGSKSGMEISEEGARRTEGEKFIGYLSVKGTSRFSTLVFTTEGGVKYKLIFDESKDASKKDEIKSMTGLRLEIEGQVSGQGIKVSDFRIIPDKEYVAVVGIKGKEGTIIDRGSGEEFILLKSNGDLFLGETGSLMWVIGKNVEKREILIVRFNVIKRTETSNRNEKTYLK